MREFLITSLIGILLIGVCSLVIYELLRFVWGRLPRMTVMPRARVLLVVASVFLGHIINIWIFGIAYYALAHVGLGTLVGAEIASGNYALDFFGYLYFSAVSYSTVGFGDVTPEGALRMIAGVEGLTGFILIGWTVTFTYLAMEKFWSLPHNRNKK
ncbi:MAG: potassium channel family protein [Alphaproteobacteria bacterium]|nr:potassium channel family protein [Alphaproteobacteria bacterium]